MTPTTIQQRLQAKVTALSAEFAGITFGYLGNCGFDSRGEFDDRSWYVFLPHPGRVGTLADRVGGYADLTKMEAAWDRIEATVRRKMSQQTEVR